MKVAWIPETKYKKFLASLADSSRQFGCTSVKVEENEDYSDFDVVISFSNTPVRIMPHQTWLHVDGAYFGRPDYMRVTKNAYCPAMELGERNYPSDRWDRLNVKISKWNPNNDGAIYICKVSERNAKFNGVNQEADIERILPILKKQTDREIIIREKEEKFSTPFSEILKKAWRVITWTSISGLDAVVAGIPVCVLARSVCHTVATSINDINRPRTPNRGRLLHNIAYFQWTRDEVCNGQVWKHYMVNNEKLS